MQKMTLSSIAGLVVIAIVLSVNNLSAYGYDRLGNDIASLDVQNPDECAKACNGNSNCLAWTFVRKGLKSPTSARCYLKNPVPPPSLNGVCLTNIDCVSGLKEEDGTWCGESPNRNADGSDVLGQGVVLSCSSGKSCGPRITREPDHWCWFLFVPYRCHGDLSYSLTYYCQ